MTIFTAPSTGWRVRAVLMDTFGTVVDWRTGIAAAVRAFARDHGLRLDPEEFADAWRARYQPAMQRVRSGQRPFVSLDVLHRENLDDVLRSRGLDPGAFAGGELAGGELDELNRAWHFLPPWPDSAEGIALLKRDFITGTLSNGSTALLVNTAKAGGLAWDVILGSDVTRAYKPSPEAYLRQAEFLGLEPGEVMLLAAHNQDLAAARALGFATGFVARPTEHGPDQKIDLTAAEEWDVIADSITGVAERLSSQRG